MNHNTERMKASDSSVSTCMCPSAVFLVRQSKLGFVVTVVLRNKTDLSSDEVELGVTLHTSRALEGGGEKEKQDVTQHAELERVTFNSSAKEKIFQAIFKPSAKQTFIIQAAS